MLVVWFVRIGEPGGVGVVRSGGVRLVCAGAGAELVAVVWMGRDGFRGRTGCEAV